MSTNPRFIPSEDRRFRNRNSEAIALVEVGLQTFQGRPLVPQSPAAAQVIRGVLGRAKKRFDFELYADSFLPTEARYLVGVRDANELARIMEYINGNVARLLGRPEFSNWKGKFWHKRSSTTLILDAAAACMAFADILRAPAAAGIVPHSLGYEGAHCGRALLNGGAAKGVWVDRTGLGRALGRRKVSHAEHEALRRRHSETVEYAYDILPAWTAGAERLFRDWIARICAGAESPDGDGCGSSGKEGSLSRGAPRAIALDRRQVTDHRIRYRRFVRKRSVAVALLRVMLPQFRFPQGGILPTNPRTERVRRTRLSPMAPSAEPRPFGCRDGPQ